MTVKRKKIDLANPEYYRIPSADKYRRMEGSLKDWPAELRHAYGQAVEEAIRGLQRAALNAGTRTPTPRDEPLGEDRRVMLRNRLTACPGVIRRARTPAEWQKLYDTAMTRSEHHASV